MLTKINGFTLIEVMIVIAIISILVSISYPKINNYVNYFTLTTELNQLISDLQWARQQSIVSKIKHGIIFYPIESKYQIVKDKINCKVIKEVSLSEDKIRFGDITFPSYKGGKAIFFKTLGNLDNHNGSIELIKVGYGSKKIVYSSNAGVININ
ncbi:pilus assembly FimT family protein [Orenia marismortui]|uniref:pilus assembly FimT family protein n=1 Tax=Orenia marismortui TaxID=46469 RepID=UPI00036BFA75|nr:prepilin-type N-terminal cleavage/methylation domain-containing protein [Orenia marismortui]